MPGGTRDRECGNGNVGMRARNPGIGNQVLRCGYPGVFGAPPEFCPPPRALRAPRAPPSCPRLSSHNIQRVSSLLSRGVPGKGWGGQKRCSASGTRLSLSSCSRCSTRGSSSSPSCRFSRVRTLTVPRSRSRRPTTAGARPSGGARGSQTQHPRPAQAPPNHSPPSSEQHPPPWRYRGSRGRDSGGFGRGPGGLQGGPKGGGGLRGALGGVSLKRSWGVPGGVPRGGAGEFPRGIAGGSREGLQQVPHGVLGGPRGVPGVPRGGSRFSSQQHPGCGWGGGVQSPGVPGGFRGGPGGLQAAPHPYPAGSCSGQVVPGGFSVPGWSRGPSPGRPGGPPSSAVPAPAPLSQWGLWGDGGTRRGGMGGSRGVTGGGSTRWGSWRSTGGSHTHLPGVFLHLRGLWDDHGLQWGQPERPGGHQGSLGSTGNTGRGHTRRGCPKGVLRMEVPLRWRDLRGPESVLSVPKTGECLCQDGAP